jgi:hypothetical protein
MVFDLGLLPDTFASIVKYTAFSRMYVPTVMPNLQMSAVASTAFIQA